MQADNVLRPLVAGAPRRFPDTAVRVLDGDVPFFR
jgi:hypothetical protein